MCLFLYNDFHVVDKNMRFISLTGDQSREAQLEKRRGGAEQTEAFFTHQRRTMAAKPGQI